jgi:protein required for attachment to host cells
METTMTKPLRTQFIVADGARARWVERSQDADDFVTVSELKANAHAHGHPEGVVFEGVTGGRFTVERRGASAAERDRDHFARAVAEVINASVAHDGAERLVLVAPARLLHDIRAHLSKSSDARLASTLAKDLTHARDHELGAWLRPFEL